MLYDQPLAARLTCWFTMAMQMLRAGVHSELLAMLHSAHGLRRSLYPKTLLSGGVLSAIAHMQSERQSLNRLAGKSQHAQ